MKNPHYRISKKFPVTEKFSVVFRPVAAGFVITKFSHIVVRLLDTE